MKKMKKIVSLLLAMVMVLAMTSTVFASETNYSLTIKGTKTGHIYNVYQIFTGDISGTAPNYILSNVKYGQNYGTKGNSVSDSDLNAITDGDVFADNYTEVGEAFRSVSSVDGNTVINELPAGYYLVKEGAIVTGQDAATKIIVQVVGNTEVDVKSDVPTVEKKVKENTKTITGNTDMRIPDYIIPGQYNDIADYNIGDDVDFQLIGTLPSNYDDYDTYKYYFIDTLSEGLTYVSDSVKVHIGSSNGEDITSLFTASYSGTSLTFNCENLKTNTNLTKDSKIIVDYKATLNSNAIIGLNGNPNEVFLKFSNNPNKGGEGDMGETPKDEVIVFTYELDTTKISGTEYVKAPEGTDDAHKDTDGYLLDDAGNKVPLKLQGAEFKLKNASGKWAIIDSNSKVTGWADTEAGGSTLTSDANGLFKVIGLDDGTYKLKETKAPTGYNLLSSEITVVITATTKNDQNWTDGKASSALKKLEVTADGAAGTGDVNSGIAGITVGNNKGATLPETGGMGTTIFYVVGVILVLGAVVLLITKKRMSANK